MKKMMLSIALSFLAVTGVWSNPQAVVFDWGSVIPVANGASVVKFIRESLHLSQAAFEQADLERIAAVASGTSDVDFWLEFAAERGIYLPRRWAEIYLNTLRASAEIDPKMHAIIEELRSQNIRVGLLSNSDDPHTQWMRDMGFYDCFDPCLFLCEIGAERPDHAAYEALLTALNLSPQEVLFVDDCAENITAAHELCIDAVLFTSIDQLRSLLKARGCLK